jgi:hypothetical protein
VAVEGSVSHCFSSLLGGPLVGWLCKFCCGLVDAGIPLSFHPLQARLCLPGFGVLPYLNSAFLRGRLFTKLLVGFAGSATWSVRVGRLGVPRIS